MARSIVLEVRKAVIAGIKTALNDPAVSVTYGYQGLADDARRKQVFTNNARADHDIAAMRSGRNFRDEEVRFDIVVYVVGVGLRSEETDDLAWPIGQVVEEYIADRKSNQLAITGLNWIVMEGFTLKNLIATEAAGADGTATELTYTVRYRARLT